MRHPLSCLLISCTLAYVGCGPRGLFDSRPAGYVFEAPGVSGVPRFDSCPDAAAAFAACTPLPVAVNLHYFATDACNTDSVGFEGRYINRADVEWSASDFVGKVNRFFENVSDNRPVGNAAHGAVEYDTQCVPFRAILAGVYIHCNSRMARAIPSPSRLRPYRVNADTEINYFVGTLANGDGYADALGGSMGAQGNHGASSFAHELMHMFGAPHVFGDDGCDDTWGDINYTWDKDGDGEVDQRGRRCWDWLPTPRDAKTGELAEPDYCAPGNYPTPHPCCDELNQNSNMMTYSNYASNADRSTLSPCQVEKAVRHVVTEKCAYLYGVGGRRPPREVAVSVDSGPL